MLQPARVNFITIGKSADVNEQTAAYVLKMMVQAIGQAVKKEQSIKISLKIGFIKITGSGHITFKS